jgi:hypothetical protein
MPGMRISKRIQPGPLALFNIPRHGRRRQGDNRDRSCIGVFAQNAGCLQSTHARQVDIHDNDIGPDIVGNLNAFLGRMRRQQLGAGQVANHFCEELAVGEIVFNVKDDGFAGIVLIGAQIQAGGGGAVFGYAGPGGGNIEPESGALARRARITNGALHAFDQLLGNGQADAGAFDAASLGVQTAKGFEQYRRLFLGNSDAGIGNGNAHEFGVQ